MAVRKTRENIKALQMRNKQWPDHSLLHLGRVPFEDDWNPMGTRLQDQTLTSEGAQELLLLGSQGLSSPALHLPRQSQLLWTRTQNKLPRNLRPFVYIAVTGSGSLSHLMNHEHQSFLTPSYLTFRSNTVVSMPLRSPHA